MPREHRGTRLDEGRRMHPRQPLSAVTLLLSVLFCPPARADEPLFDLGQDRLEDQYVDGDVDAEDLAGMRLGAHTASADLHGGTWLSVIGFAKQLRSGRDDL